MVEDLLRTDELGLFGSGSDLQIPDRKKARREATRRRRWRALLRGSLWAFAIGASSLALCGVAHVVIRSPLFIVKEVQVEGSGTVGADEIRFLSGIRPGANLLAFRASHVSRRLEAHPWIEHATVVKRFPDQVLIRVREERPAVLVEAQGCLYYMNGKGRLLDRVRPGAPLDFPMISGLGQGVEEIHRCREGRDLQEALSLLQALQAAPSLGPVSEIQVDRSEGLSFVLEGFPVPVRIGWSGFPDKTNRFEEALSLLVSQSSSIERVDLRFSGQIVVRVSEEDKGQIPRGGGAETVAGSGPSFGPTT